MTCVIHGGQGARTFSFAASPPESSVTMGPRGAFTAARAGAGAGAGPAGGSVPGRPAPSAEVPPFSLAGPALGALGAISCGTLYTSGASCACRHALL